MHYPTEEEEYELMYGDDMEAMDEIESTPSAVNNAITPLPSSPAFSQIPRDSSKRYFSTPASNFHRAASTPFPYDDNIPSTSSSALSEIQNLGINTRKRRLDALFGDIKDIEEEDHLPVLKDYFENNAKKLKNDEERDMHIIEQILEARKQFHLTEKPFQKPSIEKIEALHRFKLQNLSYTIPRYSFTTLTRSDKDRIYVRFHTEEYETCKIDEINCMKNGYNGLLGDAKDAIWNEAKHIVSKMYEIKDVQPTNNQIVQYSEEDLDLWVDRYRPKRYIELISDESTNRSLLQWLKLWDKIVFGKEVKKQPKEDKALNTFNKKTGKFEHFGWKRKNRNNLNTDLDELGRPVQKIALVSGPPGLGKTTLCHTIARHSGYSVLEINASDDRSPEAFRLALENGTQMKSVLTEDRKPNCIILDEIDGAPLASIEFLIKFISGVAVQKTGAKKGVKQSKFVLKRPIICICNDLYAPALRPLRQVAFVVNFPATQNIRLAERLQMIAREQSIETDLTALLALSDKTENDIRACISMLQFYNSMKKPLRLTDVMNSNVGQKDQQRNLFNVWSAIFQIQRQKRNDTSNNDIKNNEMTSSADSPLEIRMKNIVKVIHQGGDNERIMQGVFENYLHQKITDPNLDGVAEASDWFCFNDRIQSFINRQQNYSVFPYLTYSFVIWHFLFASLTWPKITFPSKGYEFSQKYSTSKFILGTIKKKLSAQMKGIGEGSVVFMETIPMLKKVISPSLRSVSLQLLSNKEKSDLDHTVEIMADFGLNYVQVKNAEGSYQYEIEPNIDHFQFGDIANSNMSYFAKQLVAREVELEQMRRAQPKLKDKTSANSTYFDKRQSKVVNKDSVQANTNTAALPNHLMTLQPKKIESNTVKAYVARDFFGRIVTKEVKKASDDDQQITKKSMNSIVKSAIWYRYKEGFNNAVRKDVSINDLI